MLRSCESSSEWLYENLQLQFDSREDLSLCVHFRLLFEILAEQSV